MGSHNQRTWDESRSPQWRYLLQGEAMQKRLKREKEYMEERSAERTSKRKRLAQERRREKRLSKSGRKIVYTATPGGEKGRYHNVEFEKSHGRNIPREGITKHIFKGNESAPATTTTENN